MVVFLIILVWHVIGWKLMSRERRGALIARYKARRGIPQHVPHKIDAFLKK